MPALNIISTIKKTGLLGLLLMSYVFNSHAQISPGELTNAHAQLEGILNCTKCHVLGDKVSNEKCLECHKEIKSRIDQNKGYHVSTEVKGKDCFSCHSDHHGRNFDIIRFDADHFNHELTGYKLTGKHQDLDCTACHKDEWIESIDLKKKKNTYLGLKNECIACHNDVHQNTLSKDCASCHNTEAFTPAVLFDHNTTDFPLKGKHKDVDCKRCHELTFTNSTLFQRFAGIPFNSCVNCHEDFHDGKFGDECKKCHTEESFNVFVGKSSFDHNQTDFPLIGKHRQVDCTKCHKMGEKVNPESVFQDYRGKETNNCLLCHKDVHEAKFGTDCKKCHTEESFQKVLHLDQFDHGPTGYALEGKHLKVDCRKCHVTEKMTDTLSYGRCADCHDDFHKGQFIKDELKPDCKECHNLDGFTNSSYTLEKHNKGVFPLEGAHLATACISCHKKNEEWSFRNIGNTCVDCHADIHEGFLSEKYYPQKSCNTCHSPEEWSKVSFEHQLTGFELKGKHDQTLCINCHKPDSVNTADNPIPFIGLKTECVSCHENVHDQQFEVEGITDCTRCHQSERWKPSDFDHNTARFKLDGAHKNIACEACHKTELVDGKNITQYRLEQFECATCHNQ